MTVVVYRFFTYKPIRLAILSWQRTIINMVLFEVRNSFLSSFLIGKITVKYINHREIFTCFTKYLELLIGVRCKVSRFMIWISQMSNFYSNPQNHHKLILIFWFKDRYGTRTQKKKVVERSVWEIQVSDSESAYMWESETGKEHQYIFPLALST